MSGNVCPKYSDQKKNIIHAYDYPKCDGLRGGYEDKKVEENKSWNEFLEWANELGETESKYFTYINCADYEKIGLLIEYLKSKDTDKVLDVYKKKEKGFEVHIKDLFTVENLETWVKELKPKEDSEIEKLAIELRKVCTAYSYEPLKDQWEAIAKKAIESIRGER